MVISSNLIRDDMTKINEPNLKQELVASLEELMVKQFRNLQSLIKLTQQEREALTKGDSKTLKPIVEEKETILDQLGVLEDSRHMIIDEIAQSLNIEVEDTKIPVILENIDKTTAERIDKLSQCIKTLVEEIGELNLGNQALAANTLNWLEATQSFLISFYSQPDTYDSFGKKPNGHQSILLKDIDQKA
jgi:flagellar biosynthesis/type III secretory pathway chaperone